MNLFNAEREEAIMLAAPFGEHRIVGTVAIDITRDNKSFGISWPITCSIYPLQGNLSSTS